MKEEGRGNFGSHRGAAFDWAEPNYTGLSAVAMSHLAWPVLEILFKRHVLRFPFSSSPPCLSGVQTGC